MANISEVHLSQVRFTSNVSPTQFQPKAARTVRPQNLLEAYEKAAEALRKLNYVNQLDQAEALAQDAYTKVKDPNATAGEILVAQLEMHEADAIRKKVEKHLSPLQQVVLEHINEEEQEGVMAASHHGSSQFAHIEQWLAHEDMKKGAEDSKLLDDWVLSS
jgi:hypothetical protein